MTSASRTSAAPLATSLADRIDALLPQTHCRRCGFAGCRPYAEAIATGTADIDRCPPGGERGLAKLAQLLGVPPKSVNPECGAPTPDAVAVVDESACIGCALCLPACPVDAILGAPRHLHAVIAVLCTGCELCLPPCPVDCIAMVTLPEGERDSDAVRLAAAGAARDRHRLRSARLEGERELPATSGADAHPADDQKRTAVHAAIERAKAWAASDRGPERTP